MDCLRRGENIVSFRKGIPYLLVLLAAFFLAFQPARAEGATVTPTYSGEIPTSADPVRVAVDSATGNIYITVPSIGSVLEYTQAGAYVQAFTGFGDPLSVAVDSVNGLLFVGDKGDGSVSVMDLNGNHLYYLGVGPGEFGVPGDIAVTQTGQVYVTDSANDIVNVYDGTTGTYQFSFGSYGAGNGQFNFPTGIACDDANQEIYVVDQVNGRVEIFDFTGTYKRTISGSANTLTRAQGIYVSNGDVYVADAYQSAVEVFDTSGNYLSSIGTFGTGAGQFSIPMDVAVSGSTLYVSNSENTRVETFSLSYLYSISGSALGSGGAAIQGATVTLTATGVNMTATTDAAGNYQFNGLADGTYTLSISKTGYDFVQNTLNATVSNADVTGRNFAGATHNISGTVTVTGTGASPAGVTITLSAGNLKMMTITDAAGNYMFTGVDNGTYTLTPGKTGYSFTPPSAVVTVAATDLTGLNFVGASYFVSGSVTDLSTGAPIAGATVLLVAPGVYRTAITDSAGNYTISPVGNGTYTLRASLAGYDMNPASASVTVNNADVTGENFTGATYSISGNVTDASTGAGIAGARLLLTGSGMYKSVTTDSAGNYTISPVGSGTYTLRVSMAGYTMTPPNASVTVSGANAIQNFTGITYSISGRVTDASTGAGLAGVRLLLTGSGLYRSVTTDATGNYTITPVGNGTYSLSASLAGYDMTPPGVSVTVSGANVTRNFQGTTHVVSGSVTNTATGAGIAGVRVLLTGSGLYRSVTTDATGNYTITPVGNGTYTVSASLAGYDMTPPSVSVTVNGADVTQNFQGTTHVVSGSVTNTATGAGIAGVRVLLTGAGLTMTATTDATGNYAITPVGNGTYTMSARLAGYDITPASVSVTVNGTDVTQNFQGTTHSISGSVTDSTSGAPIAGVTITLGGSGIYRSTATDSSGNYSFTPLGNGSYTLRAVKAAYTMNPATASMTVNGADVTQNIQGTTYIVSGTVRNTAGTGLAGITVLLNGPGVYKTVTTDSTGAYSITPIGNGTYTVTPRQAGYTMTPANTSVIVSGADVSGQDFTAGPAPVVAAAKGPAAMNSALVRVTDLTGNTVSQFTAFPTAYGAKVAMGTLPWDTSDVVIVTPGEGPANQAQLKVFHYDGTLLASIAAVANTEYGASAAAGNILGNAGEGEVVMSMLSTDGVTHTIVVYSADPGNTLTQKSSFSFTSSAPVTAPAGVALGDVNGDGNPELVVSYASGDGTTNTIAEYTFDTSLNATLVTSTSIPLGSTVACGDMSGTGTAQIIIGYTDGTDSLVRYMDGSLAYIAAAQTVFAGGASAPSLSATDVDSDGAAELLTGMGPVLVNSGVVRTWGSKTVQLTMFSGRTDGVNAALGVINR